MARTNHSASSNCLATVFTIGLVAYLVVNYPWWALTALVVIVAIGIAKMRPARCQVCGNPFGKTIYTWTLDGKNQKVCSHCNQSLRRKSSSEAMKKRP